MMSAGCNPPKLASWFLNLIAQPEEKFPVLGDLEEDYREHAVRSGRLKANIWYWFQVLKISAPIIRRQIFWHLAMMKNYLKGTWRSLKRHKSYSLINITGLAMGMACTILILLWVRDERSYDRFNKNADQIYRIVKYSDYGGNKLHIALTPGPLARAMKEELPEVLKATSFDFAGGTAIYKDKLFSDVEVAGVEPDFFEIFSYPLIKGNLKTALSDKNSIIITKGLAERIFGSEDPTGKVLNFNKTYDYKVTGIMENVPHNSHLQFECIIPFKMLEEFGRSVNNWRPNSFYTYIMLRKGVNEEEFNEKILNFKREHYPDCRDFLYLQPLTKIHLYSDFGYDVSGHGDIKYVIIFSMIAGFMLLIACINFMNLTTARSSNRAKEVGLRKVVGATKKELIIQFFSESILMSFLALIFAIPIVFFLLPYFNEISGKQLHLNTHGNISLLYGLLLITLITGLISGTYPALLLSSFQPVKVLKGTLKAGAKSSLFRKTLVVTQFTLSAFLIISTFLVSSQLRYIRNMKLGFEKEHLIYARIPSEYGSIWESLKNELLINTEISNVTRMRSFPTSDHVNSYSDLSWEGKNPEDKYLFCIHDVGYDFFKTFGMTMAEGRGFSRQFQSDAGAYILNEKAVDVMGIQNPVGKMFAEGERRGQIIGVVKNFHFQSLKEEIEPLVFRLPVSETRIVFIKISSDNIVNAMSNIEMMWKNFVPDYPVELRFLDDDYDRLYRSEIRAGKLFGYFTFLAIFIAGLGLFGLASFMAQQRTKEIGIRKALGASVSRIFVMLSREFLILVVFSNIVAWPVAYYFMKNWLQNFAYHTDIKLIAFMVPFVLLIIVTLLTVSYQSIKAALANPVDSLRYE